MKPEGRVAIVAGAGEGTGRAVAEKRRAEGTSVVAADIGPAVAFLASREEHWINGQMFTAVGWHTRN
jgi:S-adenosylhomocysteine hydrolase